MAEGGPPETEEQDGPRGATRRDWLAGAGGLALSAMTGIGAPAVAAPIAVEPPPPDESSRTGPSFRRVYLQK